MNDFDKRMAKRALFMLRGRKGSFQGNQIAQSARKILEGGGSQADVEIVRAFTGDQRSGASSVKGFTKGLRGAIGRAAGLGQAISMSEIANERGSGNAAATANLYRTAEGVGLDALKSQPVRGLARAIAGLISDDPALSGRFLKSLGRGVRLGGAVGQSLLFALGIAEDVVGGRAKLAQSQSRALDLNRQMNSNPEIARNAFRSAFANARNQAFFGSQQGVFQHAPDLLREFLESRVAADAESRHREELALRMSARGALAEFGIDPNSVIGTFARQRGVSPDMLTERERNEALDNPFDALLRGMENGAEARRYAESEYSKISLLERARLAAAGGVEAKLQDFKHEFALKNARTQAQQATARQRAGDAYLESLTPLERYKKWQRETVSNAEAVAYRSRHQVAEVD